MDNSINVENGNISAIATIMLGIVALFGQSTDLLIKVVVSCGSIITAIMACRYYYFAIKEKKKILRQK